MVGRDTATERPGSGIEEVMVVESFDATERCYRLDWEDQFSLAWVMSYGRNAEREGHLTPYQIILATLTVMYATRHLDDLFGMGGELFPSFRRRSSHHSARTSGSTRELFAGWPPAYAPVLPVILSSDIRQYRFRCWVCQCNGNTTEMAEGFV